MLGDRDGEAIKAFGISLLLIVLAVFLWTLIQPDNDEEDEGKSAPEQVSLPSVEPATVPDPAPTATGETVTEHTVPAVCVDVIRMNEMLVVSGQDVYSDAINALVDGKVEGIREATEGLEAYHDLVSEVNKNYESSRQECLGTSSDADEAKQDADK